MIPLTAPPTCVQLFNKQQLCEFEGGIWYAQPQYSSCCKIYNAGIYNPNVSILPDFQTATRNDIYKLVELTSPDCSAKRTRTLSATSYTRSTRTLLSRRSTTPANNLCQDPPGCPAGLSGVDLDNYNALLASQQATLSSEPPCPGDGNEDKMVNQLDIDNWTYSAGYPKRRVGTT